MKPSSSIGPYRRVEPAVFQNLRCGRRILVVAEHNAGPADDQLTDLSLGTHLLAPFRHDSGLPEIAGLTDGSYLVDVLHSQMDAARPQGFAEAVVGVIGVVGEDLLPTVDQAGRYRLGRRCASAATGPAGSCQGPPGLRQWRPSRSWAPGHQEPHDGTFLLGDGPENPLRLTREAALPCCRR